MDKIRLNRIKRYQRISGLIQSYRQELEKLNEKYPQYCRYFRKLNYKSKKLNIERIIEGWSPQNVIGTTMFHVLGSDEKLRELAFKYIEEYVKCI